MIKDTIFNAFIILALGGVIAFAIVGLWRTL